MAKKIDIFYRGIDIPKFTQSKTGEIKLAFIGRIVALKGVFNLLETYKNVSIKNELIIIGDGEEREKLEKLAKGLNVKFLGFKDRDFILDFLQKNNIIVVNPSFQEGLPTVVIEGLLTGNVVIASDVGGTREISNKKDLILFEAGNNEDLKEKLKFALENFEDLKGLSRESVREKFNWERSIERLYKLVR